MDGTVAPFTADGAYDQNGVYHDVVVRVARYDRENARCRRKRELRIDTLPWHWAWCSLFAFHARVYSVSAGQHRKVEHGIAPILAPAFRRPALGDGTAGLLGAHGAERAPSDADYLQGVSGLHSERENAVQRIGDASRRCAAIEQLPIHMPDRDKAVELLSPRYVASWGEDADSRHCYVGVVFAAVRAGLPVRLGVPTAGFLQRVTSRAMEEGLGVALVADELSPLAISTWSEPETGHDRGPLRPVSMSIIATTPANADGIAEAGLIVMGGPPGTR